MPDFLKLVKSTLKYLLIIFFALFFFFPLFWMMVVSIKLSIDSFTMTFIPFLQFNPTLENWKWELITTSAQNIKFLLNSTTIGLGTAAIATLLGGFAGYALARYEFKRVRNINILTWFLSLRFLPPIALAIPLYAMMQSIGLLDNAIGMILIYSSAFTPYSVLVMRDAFKSLPPEMEESAFIDGASVLKTLRVIVLPLVAPALAAIFMLTFTFSWNEFLFALVLTIEKAVTVPIRLAGTVTTVGVLFYQLSVRQLIASVVPITLGVLVQKYIVSGLTMGAIKA